LLLRLTSTPPAGAAELRNAVIVTGAPLVTVAGEIVKDVSAGYTTPVATILKVLVEVACAVKLGPRTTD
jgi:hypothetical protein